MIDHLDVDSIPTDGDNFLVEYTNRAVPASSSKAVFINSNPNVSLKIRFNRATNVFTSKGYLDYLLLSFSRNLTLNTNFTLFRSRSGSSSFRISTNESNPLVWDITDPTNAVMQTYESGSGAITFTGPLHSENEYVILKSTGHPVPGYFGQVKNQNIKSTVGVDGIIISHPLFLNEAKRLASFHQQHDGLTITVVTPQEIYNEFSSGMQDLTAIRDYLKYVKDSGQKLKYACLFGDASYDYRDRTIVKGNFVPIYESRDSFHKIYSYSSDDFIGFLEEDEGQWLEQRSGDHTLDIGIGRLPVNTAEQAQQLVDKIIRYATSSVTFGKWRTQIVYMADDGDGGQHMSDVEYLYNLIESNNPEYEVKRLFLDDFVQVEVSNNVYRSPDMIQAFKDQVKKGAFIIDYLGHGNPTILMKEQVIVTPQLVYDLSNRHKLPMIVTATCDFGKYDEPITVSGAENFLLNPSGGAIALLTTTRPVFSSTNKALNAAFHEHVFKKIDGQYPRLGDVVRETKNNGLAGPVNRNFALLGDPMLRLNYPELTIRFDELESSTDTLSALELVTTSWLCAGLEQYVSRFF